jgi:hypothetical protein
LIVTLVFDKNANFFAENCWKSQKIVIITSTTPEGQGHGCQIFSKYNKPKRGKIYQRTVQTKLPNGHKIYTMVVKYY